MILNIIDKKTGEKVSLNIKSFHFDNFCDLWEYINNIADFNLNIVDDEEED